MCPQLPQCLNGGQRTTCSSLLARCTLLVPGRELRSPGLVVGTFSREPLSISAVIFKGCFLRCAVQVRNLETSNLRMEESVLAHGLRVKDGQNGPRFVPKLLGREMHCI